MMNFIKVNDCWWEVDLDQMRLYNFRGGHCNINENADYWLNGTIFQFDTWLDLMHAKRYNPFLVDEYANDVWISPDGEYWEGQAHSVAAEYIVWYLYNPHKIDIHEMDYNPWYDAEEVLLSNGWIKASDAFWTLHFVPNMVMNERQAIALHNWCYIHNIDFPEDEIIIRENLCY